MFCANFHFLIPFLQFNYLSVSAGGSLLLNNSRILTPFLRGMLPRGNSSSEVGLNWRYRDEQCNSGCGCQMSGPGSFFAMSPERALVGGR